MSFITSRLDRDVLVVTFEDPKSRNSWSLASSRELAAVLKKGGFRALVFRSVGRVFCSGGNLSDYGALSKAEEGHAINREITAGLDAIATLSVPTICLVEGDCFGGGVELVSAFDVVVATPHVFFGLWQKKIGLTFGWGGGARLLRRVGESRLREWTLSTRAIGAGEARSSGLISEVCAVTDAEMRAIAIARRMADGSVGAGKALKEFDPSHEREIFESLWWTDDHRRVLAARKR